LTAYGLEYLGQRVDPLARSANHASRPQRLLADGYHASGGALMSREDNKAIIRAYVETVWNQQQLDRADEVVAPDFLDCLKGWNTCVGVGRGSTPAHSCC
jgi:hypothetical protein